MGVELGIIFAFVAMFAWGVGDFFIQRSTRKFGDWETLFFISLFGVIFLFPFVYKDIPTLFLSFDEKYLILLAPSFTILIAALFEFESLKRGKISVVEPLWSLEVPVSALAAFFILKEIPSTLQIILIITLLVGLVLVSLRSYHLEKKIWLEKAVIIGAFSAIIMGLANFLVGVGARETNALIINWFLSTFLALACFIYLISKKNLRKTFKDVIKNKKLLFSMCTLDNIAWVAFAFSMTLAPIALAVALSESYIIIAVLLGLFVNKEYLRKHQKIGLIIAIISAILLASLMT
ncbi:DMT family transporter [Candidatus Pacearchaeota archaeon]|nr:DMT family transporter [Candidatus Pacearchaeota archaeon]